jgi:prevent-host-death family protein
MGSRKRPRSRGRKTLSIDGEGVGVSTPSIWKGLPVQVLQCSIVRKTSVRELHIHTSELVREAADGGIIVIERRGEPVAELRPLSSPAPMPAGKKARIFSSMRKIWARMPKAGDSTKILEEDRNR